MAPLRVAAFQRRPLFGDVRGVLGRLTEDLDWCRHQEVQLALFPECYLQGYATDRETIVSRSLALDGHDVREILSVLRKYPTTIILGLIERRGASCFNSAVVIREGRVLGTYAKTHPNEPGFDAGMDYPIFTTHDWPFGINICNDANFPDAAMILSRQGARLLCYPLNNMLLPKNATKWRSRSVSNLQARAVETGCWVMSSDVVGHHGNQMSYGCTCIVSPNGDVVSRAPEEAEAAVRFDLRLFASEVSITHANHGSR
jgi:predicted amidohydrolase